MKKVIYSFMLLASVAVFASCDHEFLGDKDPVGGTATEAAAGEWYVMADGIDADGEVIDGYEDFYGGRFKVLSFNTAENVSNKMYIQEDAELTYFNNSGYGFQVEVDLDPNTLTFSSTDAPNIWGSSNITIKNGKISKGTGVQNNGSKCDEISFEVYFDVTDEYYCAYYGHAGYKIYGVRYSGLTEND